MLRMLSLLAILLSSYVGAGPVSTSKINWMTNYEDAVMQAKRENKPLLLFFTGSDWCGWCHKLENEALSTTEFADAANDQFVFVLVDFPLKTAQDGNIKKQNQQLQKDFDVKGYPAIILLDPNNQQIGNTGYRPGGGRAYADHLLKMVEDYKAYHQKLSQLSQDAPSINELQALYGKAKELCRSSDAQKIVKIGSQSPDNHFFLLEQFRMLADEGKLHGSEAQTVKQQLLAKDPHNKQKTHYAVAIIEFEALTEEMEHENYASEIAISPLVGYIERFGDEDEENVWRLHMLIAQVYLDQKKGKEALKHAQACHATAPEEIQPEIQAFILNIQK